MANLEFIHIQYVVELILLFPLKKYILFDKSKALLLNPFIFMSSIIYIDSMVSTVFVSLQVVANIHLCTFVIWYCFVHFIGSVCDDFIEIHSGQFRYKYLESGN
jgi:hypothetical protein